MTGRMMAGPVGSVLLALAASTGPTDATAQTTEPMEDTPEAHYFDFWPGMWAEVVEGSADTTATVFHVQESVHGAAFEERWRLMIEGRPAYSVALRAWDRTAARWMFTWVSANGLFQVWEGRKYGDDWYIVRPFEIDGERFLSRQAWIPTGEDELVRVMERSFDEGQTWVVRSRTTFRRVR